MLFGGLILSFFLNAIGTRASTTPLCLLCPCSSPPNIAPNINCVNTKVVNIFENKFWFDEFNQSYPIQSLTYETNDLINITTKFPTSNLTILNLRHNKINRIDNGVFSGLQKMEKLILSGNDIHYFNPDAFRGVYDRNEYFPLKSLRTLDLSYNRIHTLNADSFEHVDELEILILRNNPFKFIDTQTLSAISSLVYLKELDLSYTLLQDLPENFMHTSRSLKVLDLSGNKFTSPPKALEESHALEELYLNNNSFTYLGKSNTFRKISTLRTLHMSYMPLLERVCEYSFSGLKNLEEIHMNYNKKLALINPKAFIISSNGEELHIPLKKVFINNNNLTYLEKNTLNITGIEDINITGNPWSCDCKNQWLIDEVISVYLKVDETAAKYLRCEKPEQMKHLTLYQLRLQDEPLSCLNSPFENVWFLIGVISGILLGIVAVVLILCTFRIKIVNIANFNNPAYRRVQLQ